MNNNNKASCHDGRDKPPWDQNEKPLLERDTSFKVHPPSLGPQNFDSSHVTKDTKNGQKIFQQFIAPQNHMQQEETQTALPTVKKQEQSTHLSNLGKQAMAQFGTDQKVIDTQGPPNQVNQVDRAGSQKKLSVSFEEAQTQFYGLKKSTEENKDSRMNNNLNQNLKQIQPQTIKRGQKRHFHANHDIKTNMIFDKNVGASQQKDQQSSNRIRRAPYISGIVQGMSPLPPQSQGNQSIKKSTTKSIFDHESFQKNRKLTLQMQSYSLQKPESQKPIDPEKSFEQQPKLEGASSGSNFHQFKSVFPASTPLGQFGQQALGINKRSPKNQALAVEIVGQAIGAAVAGLDNQSPAAPPRRLVPPKDDQMQVFGTSLRENTTSNLSGEQQLSSNKKRQLSLINKTDEKVKHNSLTKNFRKYKKTKPEINEQEINVLGQPLQSRQPEDFQSIIDKSYGKRMGTGLRGKFQTRLLQQTSLNLPSMTEKTQAAQNEKQQSFIRRKHSIFSSNFSSNPDNVIIDQNYTMKGSNETQRIAWEIKFNQSIKKDKEDNNDQSFQEIPRKQTKSFKVQTNRPNVVGTTILNQSLNVTGPPLSTKNMKLKLQKINQKVVIPQRLQTISPSKKQQNGMVNQIRGMVATGVPSIANTNSGKVFRRQTIRIQGTLKGKLTQKQAEIFKAVNQTIGELPAELIVQGYKQNSEATPSKEMPKIEESFLQRQEDESLLQQSKKEKSFSDNDLDAFFANTSEREFDEYMQASEIVTPLSNFNPSNSPIMKMQLLKQMTQSMANAKNIPTEQSQKPKVKNRTSKWSGSAKTQMKFYNFVNQNKQIREKLAMLKNIGISNESNSLFQQLINDIKKVAKQEMTHEEIVSCIKAQSNGSQNSAFEQQSNIKKAKMKGFCMTLKKSRSLINIEKRNNYMPNESCSVDYLPRSFKIVQQDNFMGNSSDQNLTNVQKMAYLNNSQLIIKKSKIYQSHSNLLKSYQQMQISQGPGVQSEKHFDYRQQLMIQKSGLVLNPRCRDTVIGQSIEQSGIEIETSKVSQDTAFHLCSKIPPNKPLFDIERAPVLRYPDDNLLQVSSDPKKPIVISESICELNSASAQSSGDKVCGSSNYVQKYQKSHQVQYVNKMINSLFEPEPVEYGKIIRWRQGEIIGLGSSSIVYSAIRVDNNTLLAVKKFKVVSDVTGIDQNKLKTIKNEIQKYKQLEHENIVRFYGCELLDQFFCMYLEQMETSLANVLSEYGFFDEVTIRYYTKQILSGLAFLHDKKIKHLDLKCSNILTNNDGVVKLCDFGSSREFKKGSQNGSSAASSSFTSLKSQIVGSVQWMAPEVIIEKGSGSKSDIWSLGCTIVEMFNGGNPWGNKIDDQNLYLAQQIITGSDMLPQIPKNIQVSPECQDFLAQCLNRDYDQRPSAFKLLEHPWILQEK